MISEQIKKLHIGFFDSGIGGLIYLDAFNTKYRKILLSEQIFLQLFYLADNAGFPYGSKDTDILKKRILTLCLEFITKKQLDILVLACNTATVLVIDALRDAIKNQCLHTLVVGTVPAINPALTMNIEKVYVMSTLTTSKSSYIPTLIERLKEHRNPQVFLRPQQALVEYIELYLTQSRNDNASVLQSQVQEELVHIVDDIISLKAKALVLGCTHYLHIKPMLRDMLPSHIEIIDSLDGVIRRTYNLILKHNMPTLSQDFVNNDKITSINHIDETPQNSEDEFYCTSNNNNIYKSVSEEFALSFKSTI